MPTPLVLVSGSGRSGTSSLAGTLKRLGLHVPQPEVEASETNPRGFYEPQWVIDFHKRHLNELALFNIDSRPAAVDLVAHYVESGEPHRRAARVAVGPARGSGTRGDQIVVKDPHAFWFAQVWEQVTAELDVDLRWLTALRHPAEVVGSRDIAYLSSQSDDLRLTKETSNVAGWVHAALLTERAGRGRKRSFVRYTDLLADWRTALEPVQKQLDLDLQHRPRRARAAPGRRLHRALDAQVAAHLGRRQDTRLAARHGRGGLAAPRGPHRIAPGPPTPSPRSTGSTTTTTPATPRRSPSPSTTRRPSRRSPGARPATPSARPSSSCGATSRRHGGTVRRTRPPSAAARRPRSCAAPSYAASPAADAQPRFPRLSGDT